MNRVFSSLNRLQRDRRGVTALEYGLIAAVVVVVGLAGFSGIGTELAAKFTQVNTMIGDDSGAAPAADQAAPADGQ